MVSEDKIGPMLTVPELDRLLHIHNNMVRRRANQGILKAYRITSRGDRRFRRADIAHFLAELNVNEDNKEKAVPGS